MLFYREEDRYGAIMKSNNRVINIAGFGAYAGRSVPKEAVRITADPFKTANIPCAKIKLDNGGYFYACEGYINFEEIIQLQIIIWELTGKIINYIDDINEARRSL